MSFKFISRQTGIDKKIFDLEVLKELENAEYIAFDFETTGLDIFKLSPVLLGLETGTIIDDNGNIIPGNSYIIDFLTIGLAETAVALKKYNLLNKLWIAHNLVYDYMVFEYHFGIKLDNVHCTQLSSQVLYNGSDAIQHNYKAVVYRHFDKIVSKEDVQSFINRDLSRPIEEFELNYLKNDLVWLRPLYLRHIQLGAPSKKDLLKCFDLENKFIRVMSHMMLNGITIDGNKWIKNYESYYAKSDELREKITKRAIELCEEFGIRGVVKSKGKKVAENQLSLFSQAEMDLVSPAHIAMKNFNPRSPDQVKKILVDLKVNILDTSEDSLRKSLFDITDERIREFINLLLELREYEKLVSTYGLKFLNDNLSTVTFRMHTNYMQCFTDTGRLSSSKPNLQNIPKRKEMRECFVADDEEYRLGSFDMSGQELRIAASRSQDKVLLASFNEGLDLHSYLAQDSYRIIKQSPGFVVSKEENEELRDLHKQVIFGYIFGAGPHRIAEVLNIPLNTAQIVFKKLEENVKELSDYQKRLKKKVFADKYAVDGSYYNRRQSFDVWRKKPLEKHQIEKKGINFPIQATAASMTKEAGIEILKYIEENNLDCQIKLQIHDEYLIQIPADREDLALEFKRIMEEVGTSYLQGVVMKSSMKIEKHWSK